MLPPYVVYKAGNIYEAWKQGGPKGAHYTYTPSGWFDGCKYLDWFKQVFLRHAKRKPGKKLLIVDNLSSHISAEVIKLCKTHNIAYVCLPPNSTDKLQPLDVGVFGPMKHAWRNQLKAYSDKDPAADLLQKTEFPKMLKELLDTLNPGRLLPKAFERCRLWPINQEKALEKIPSIQSSQEVATHLDMAILKKLEVRRFGDKKKPRGKKVPPGQSHSILEEEDEEVDDLSGSDTEEEDNEVEKEDSEVEAQGETSDSEAEEELPDLCEPRKNLTCYVVAIYEGQWFLAEICKDQSNVAKGYTRLSYMTIKGTNSFVWGEKEDIHVALDEDIIIEPVLPEPLNNRGHMGLKKKDHDKVLYMMVVVNCSLI